MQEEWEAEFAKYKQSPEFRRLNSRMTVSVACALCSSPQGSKDWFCDGAPKHAAALLAEHAVELEQP